MEELTQFIVENQDFYWYLLSFIFFVFMFKSFFKITRALFNARRGLKIR